MYKTANEPFQQHSAPLQLFVTVNCDEAPSATNCHPDFNSAPPFQRPNAVCLL